MTSDDRSAAEAAFACAALLEQGRKLQALSLVVTGFALFHLLTGYPVRAPHAILAGIAIALGVIALYFAIRVGLDARLMRRLAAQADEGRLDLAQFDAGLTLAGLRPAAAATRTLGDRVAGATRLLRNQALATAAQLIVLVGGAILLGNAP